MPKCVFLVDDSPAVRHSLRTIFESAGIEVCGEAENGAKAIETANQLKPDLIVLDLAMPVMNGLQAAPILRAMHPTTPIILFTLYADSVVEQEATLVGISSLVSKGEGSSHLIDEVNTLLKPDAFEDRKAD
jgi:DNA-binding NarL/FixJ family response regulator